MYILKCPKCNSEIALNDSEKETFDIDCDCGETITADNYKGTLEHVIEPQTEN